MKLVHLFDKETREYLGDELLFPKQEVINEVDGEVTFEEAYNIPENSTELPLPQPNWKPVFKDGAWIETITQDELDELNKPVVSSPTDTESLALQVSDLEISLMEEQVKGEELAQTVSALEIAILELHPN